MRTYWAALVVLAGLCEAPVAEAADLPSPDLPTKKEVVAPPLPSSWHYEITGYGWGTDLSGQAGVGPFPSSPFFINFLKLLEHFQGGLMTSFVARNDTFITGLDVILARIGAGTNFKDPTSALFGDHANLTLTLGIFTAFGGVRIPVGPPNLELYGTVGGRYFYMHSGLDLSFPVTGFEPHFGLTKNCADPVAGLAAHYIINDKWFINFLTDMGGSTTARPARCSAPWGTTGRLRSRRHSDIARSICTTATSADLSVTSGFRGGCTGLSPASNITSDPTFSSAPHHASNARATRFMNAARRCVAVKFMS
jgi:hypothetical protein